MAYYFNFLDTKKLEEKLLSKEFPFSQYLFWDTSIGNIDLEKNSRYVIERVLTRGFLEDFYLLIKIYSKEEIVVALKKSKELDPKTIDFCSYYFNLPKSEMHVSSFYS
jgi:hypothetical protein